MSLKKYSRCKTMLLYLIGVSVVSTAHCKSHGHGPALVTKSKASQKHVKALNHVNVLLGDLQGKIKDSRNILTRIAHSNFLRHLAREEPASAPRPGRHGAAEMERVLSSLGVPHTNDPAKAKAIVSKLANALSMLRTVLLPGDVLSGDLFDYTPSTKDPFEVALQDEMTSHHLGYLSVGFERLCKLVAVKNSKDMRAVLRYAEGLVERWLNQPALTVLNNMAMAASGLPADELKSYAIMLHFTMLQRRDTISPQVNALLDLADSLMKPPDGEHLFEVIREFRDFPNGTKTGQHLCRVLLEAFERPYHKIADTDQLRQLMNYTNHALVERFPNLDARLDVPPDYSNPSFPNVVKSKPAIVRHGIGMHMTSRDVRVRSTQGLERRRRMRGKDVIAPKKQSSISNYGYESTTMQFKRKTTSHHKVALNEKNDYRKLSNENNDFYKELSEEYGDVFSQENVTRSRPSERHPQYPPHYPLGTSHASATTLHQSLTEIESEATRDGSKRKRFTIVTPVPRDGHLVNVQEPSARPRRVTAPTQPRRYKLFDRPTTQLTHFRRTRRTTRSERTASTFKRIQYPTTKTAQRTTDKKNFNGSTAGAGRASMPAPVTDNSEHLRLITASSSYSDEETLLKDNLMYQLVHYNSSFKNRTT